MKICGPVAIGGEKKGFDLFGTLFMHLSVPPFPIPSPFIMLHMGDTGLN